MAGGSVDLFEKLDAEAAMTGSTENKVEAPASAGAQTLVGMVPAPAGVEAVPPAAVEEAAALAADEKRLTRTSSMSRAAIVVT